MKKLHIALFIMLAISFAACKKYLDIKPKGIVIPQTIEDFERILNNGDLNTTLSTYLDMLSDDYYDSTLDKNKFESNPDNLAYLWKADILATPDDENYSPYYRLYANIYQYNAVINGIGTAAGGTPARKSIAKARAQLGRALSYWYLVNLYAKPYQAQSAASDLGVPLVTSNDISSKVPGRGTVQQTFDFILKDLNEAITGLPASAPDPYQMSKAAGFGFLARTYLSMNDYAKAATAADQALALNSRLVNYNTEYETYTNGPVNFIYTKDNSQVANMLTLSENIFVLHYLESYKLSYVEIAPATEKLFGQEDLRRMYFTPTTINPAKYAKWNGLYRYMDYVNFENSIGITTPEMYLIRAEGNARLGKVDAAMADINALRKNRVKSSAYTDVTAGNSVDAVKLVLAERRKELLYKGARWFDMRRLNNDPDFGFTAKHFFADGTFITLEPNSPRYVLRLPIDVLGTGIVQNP